MSPLNLSTQSITELVSVCAGIVTLVRRVGKPTVTVGVDGSFYRFHPEFDKTLTQTINDLLGEEYQVRRYHFSYLGEVKQ